jgi:YfiH family protein
MYILEDYSKFFGQDVVAFTTNNRLNFKKIVADEFQQSREILAKLCVTDVNNIILPTQVHGDTIIKVNSYTDCGIDTEADGLISDNPDLFLGIKSADCAILVAFDPIRHVKGVAHLGRKGVLQDLGIKLIDSFVNDYGSNMGDIKFAISPCISFHSHYVFEEEAKGFEGVFVNKLEAGNHRLHNPHLTEEYRTKHKLDDKHFESVHSYMIDLPGFIKKQLMDFGILPEMVRISTLDTFTHEQSHSYRRDYPNNGLMLSLIGFKK